MGKKLRVAFVGAGYIARIHMRVLQRLQRDVEVVAIADVDSAAAHAASEELGGVAVLSDWRQVVDASGVDVVHVCTPNHLHHPVTIAALNNDKHVFSEKPLALTVAQGRELVQLAEKSEKHCGVNFCYRFYPSVREASAKIAQGDLGDLLMFTGQYFQDHLLSSNDYNWRLDPALSGPSSVIADLGCHWFDLLQFITGQRIQSVCAETDTYFKERGEPGKTRPCVLEDVGALIVRLDRGAVGTFVTSQMAAGRKCSIDLQVYGTGGSLAWNHERPAELWMGHRHQANQIHIESPVLQSELTRPFALLPSGHPMGYHDAMYNLFRSYYDAILDRTPAGAYPTFRDGLDQLEIVEAAVASAQERKWIDIESELALEYRT